MTLFLLEREMEGERYEENKEARHDSLDTHSSVLFLYFVVFFCADEILKVF